MLIDRSFWNGDSDEAKEHRRQARRELDSYLAMEGPFAPSAAPTFWEDGIRTEPPELGHMPLWQLWQKSEIGAPHLVQIMWVLAAVYPSQSGVGRKNGLIQHCVGNNKRNRMSQSSRCDTVLIADRYNTNAAGSRIRRYKREQGAVKDVIFLKNVFFQYFLCDFLIIFFQYFLCDF